MIICKTCGNTYDEKYGVCPKCGTPFEQPMGLLYFYFTISISYLNIYYRVIINHWFALMAEHFLFDKYIYK